MRDAGVGVDDPARELGSTQNFSESYLLEPVLLGEVALPVGDMVEPFVDADDIADVAVAALTEPGHAGELYELTGPRLLTFADAVDAIGRATGRDLTFVSVSMDDYVASMVEQQVPDEYVQLLAYLFTEVLDGRNASPRRRCPARPRSGTARLHRVRTRRGRRRGLGVGRHGGRPMIDGWILTLTVTGAVGTGLVAGVFFAFSTFVMRALDRLPAGTGRRGDELDQRDGDQPALHARVDGHGRRVRRCSAWRRS